MDDVTEMLQDKIYILGLDDQTPGLIIHSKFYIKMYHLCYTKYNSRAAKNVLIVMYPNQKLETVK